MSTDITAPAPEPTPASTPDPAPTSADRLRVVAGRLRTVLLKQPDSAYGAALLAFIAYLLLALQQWRRSESPSYDLGIFVQLLQRYSHFEAPIVTVKGPTYNLLGDHFHPLLAILAPFYAIAPSAFTVMVLQVILLAVSTFFIAKIAHEHLGVAGGWFIGLAYATCWGVQQAAAVQFHEVALGAPILAIALWQFLRRHWLTAAIWAGLLVFVKEDLCLTVFAFGLLLAWRSKDWKLGGGLAVWGLAWTFLTFKVILPAMNPAGKYDHGKSMNTDQIFSDPLKVTSEILTNDTKMATVLLLCVGVMFLLLRTEIALLALPTLAWRFLSTNQGHWGQTWHYSLMLMPIAYAAAVEGAARLRTSRHGALRAWGVHGPAMTLAVSIALMNQMPLWGLRDMKRWELGPRQVAARQVAAMVPSGGVILADSSLMNQLVDKGKVYYIGNQGNPRGDWIVIDNIAGGWSGKVDASSYGQMIAPGTTWVKVFDAEGYQLARRVG